jgi:ubiquinone/menaquinone biosynthesis C-methylase UbiE
MSAHPSHDSRHSGGVCPWWLCPTSDNPLRRLVHNQERILAGLVQPGQMALDLGCGMGYFSIPLARLVGPDGRVVCVDLQKQMLAGVKRRAERAGVAERIHVHRAEADRLGLEESADFALAYWMLHEVPDQGRFLAEVCAALNPGGRLLLVEPRGHVGATAFARSAEAALTVGRLPVATPGVTFSRAVLRRAGARWRVLVRRSQLQHESVRRAR